MASTWTPTISSPINFQSTPTVSNALFQQFGVRVSASFTLTGTLLSTSGATDVFEFNISLPIARTSGNFTNFRQAAGTNIVIPPFIFTDHEEPDCVGNPGSQVINYVRSYSSTENSAVTLKCSFIYTLSNTQT